MKHLAITAGTYYATEVALGKALNAASKASHVPQIAHYLIIVSITSLALYKIGSHLGWKHSLFRLRHTPLKAGLAGALVAAIVSVPGLSKAESSGWLYGLMSAFVLLSASWLVSELAAEPVLSKKKHTNRRQPRQGPSRGQTSDSTDDSKSIESGSSWFRSDEPIASEEQDKLGINTKIPREISDRIADEHSLSTCIVGEWGSGKTSLARLAGHTLRNEHPNSLVIEISLWDYAEHEDASSGILSRLLEALRTRIDITSLAFTSRHYNSLISSAHPLTGQLFRFFSPNPSETLRSLDSCLEKAEIKVAIIVDDIRRFHPANGTPSPNSSSSLLALLHNLSALSHIGLIIPTPDIQGLGIDKICPHTSWIVPLSATQTCDLLREGYEEICKVHRREEGEGNSPASSPGNQPDRIRLWDGAADFTPGLVTAVTGKEPDLTIRQAIPTIASTPRRLKKLLRRFGEHCDILPSDIDLHELFVLTALEMVAPDTILWIDKYIAELRDLNMAREILGTASPSDLKAPLLGANKSLQKILNASPERTPAAIRTCLRALFVSSSGLNKTGKVLSEHSKPSVDFLEQFLRRDP